MDNFIEKVNIFIGKLNGSIIMKTLMGGMIVTMPAVMAGSFATILMNLQIPAYQAFITSIGLKGIFQAVTTVTINLTALFTVFGIAYNYAKNKGQDGTPAGLLAIAIFLMLTPLAASEPFPGYFVYSLPFDWLGAKGIFSAMLVGFGSSVIYTFATIKKWTINLPESVPSFISTSFSAIVPGLITFAAFILINLIVLQTPFASFHDIIYVLLQTPIQSIGGNIWSMLFVIFLGQLLWIVGIHGPMVVMSMAMVAWRPLDIANLTAFNAGEALPNIITFALYQTTTFAGAGLGLAILMLFARSKRFKSLGKLAVVPAAFGITEPLIFGTPIVMNLKLAIPHVLLPIISAVLGYVGIVTGLLPKLSGIGLPMGTPIVLYGYLQGGIRVALFQILLIGLWLVGWYPFFKSVDNDEYKAEQALENK